MTKLEQAAADAEALPIQIREQLGEELLHKVHKLLALRADLAAGIAELEAGKGLEGWQVMAELKRRHGA